MDTLVPFAIRLKQALDARDMTAAELSRKTGISKASISRYLKGLWKPRQDAIYLIAQATDCSEAWLMGVDVPMDRTSGLIASAYDTYSPFTDANNDAYGDMSDENKAWRKLHYQNDNLSETKLQLVHKVIDMTDTQAEAWNAVIV